MSETGAGRQLTLEQAKQSGHDTCDAVVCKTCNSVFYEGTWHPLAVESQGTPLGERRDCTDEWEERQDRKGTPGATPTVRLVYSERPDQKIPDGWLIYECHCGAQIMHRQMPNFCATCGCNYSELDDAPKPAGGTLIAEECSHRRCIGPVACPIPTSDRIGVWRWIICELCGAVKRWDYREIPVDYTSDPRLNVVEWKSPTLSVRNTAALTREFEQLSQSATERWDGITSNLRAEIERLRGEFEQLKKDEAFAAESDGEVINRLKGELDGAWDEANDKGHRLIEAEAELAHLRGQGAQQWIPVEERLPDERVWVIGVTLHDSKRKVVPIFGTLVRGKFRWESEFQVTHWQPVPTLPSAVPQPPAKHIHNFVPPPHDDEQQCDANCRETWHRCSVCGKSRGELAKEDSSQ